MNVMIVESLLVAMDKLYGDERDDGESTSSSTSSTSSSPSASLTRHFRRFYVLETVARVPYFAFTSCLHLFETLGWWRKSEYLKVHFAQSWNELHHLLIMESLGGDKEFGDRFFAQHASIFYFWMVCAMYLTSPRMAYNFQEKIEAHAFETYDKFLSRHGDALRAMPAPAVAVKYYESEDMYLFDAMRDARCGEDNLGEAGPRRRPRIRNLYDVFENVRNDEGEHEKIMQAMQQDRRHQRDLHRVTPLSVASGDGEDAGIAPTGLHQLRAGAVRRGDLLIETSICGPSGAVTNESQGSDDFEEYGCEGLLECAINDLVPSKNAEKIRRRESLENSAAPESTSSPQKK